MNTTVTSSDDWGSLIATVFKNTRPHVLADGSLHIYRLDHHGALVAKFRRSQWKNAIVVDEPQSKVHWKDLAIELGTSLQISEQARVQALARLQQALKEEGS